MKKFYSVKSITIGGIFAAIYAIVALLSIYIFNAMSIIGLLVLPIFAAYYSSVFSFKETFVFNLATLIVCFICGIGDPIYVLLYVLPSLIVGDAFGIFNKLKIKYYTTIFLQSITYSITNILALYLGEYVYDIKIIEYIISDIWIYENLSLSILFILSGAEAIFSSMFINDKLARMHLSETREKNVPNYLYFTCLGLFLTSISMFFVNYNIYFLLCTMTIILIIPIINEISNKLGKKLNLVLIGYILIIASIDFVVAYLGYGRLIPLIIVLPMVVYCIVKIAIYLYNLNKEKED